MGRGGDFQLDPDALARAEAALSALSNDYLTWVEADLAALVAEVSALRAAVPAERPIVCARLFAIAHDMKGQAGTFGYPLLTGLGNALCRLVEDHAIVDADMLGRLEALAAAMAEIIAFRLDGDGGQRGHELMARLGVPVPGYSDQA